MFEPTPLTAEQRVSVAIEIVHVRLPETICDLVVILNRFANPHQVIPQDDAVSYIYTHAVENLMIALRESGWRTLELKKGSRFRAFPSEKSSYYLEFVDGHVFMKQRSF